MSNILFFQEVVRTNRLQGLTLNCLCCGDKIKFIGNENVLEEVYFCKHCHYPINID